MTQQIRSSQFITTYGPGAILEGPDGPKIILTLQESDIFSDDREPKYFEITDKRLSDGLLNQAGIVRLPSNAELGLPDYKAIYKTQRFPTWSLCPNHHILYRKTSIEDRHACPLCQPLPDGPKAWEVTNRQAIRFVRACSAGHLDDVDWNGIIPHQKDSCKPAYLRWEGGGSALKNINIVCPNCGGRINLGNAYARDWECSGRFPEIGKERPGGCPEPARIIQRGASNLRLAEIKTALTIPPRATRLHRLLEMSTIKTVLLVNKPASKYTLLNALDNLVTGGLLKRTTYNEIDTYSEPDILAAIQDTIAANTPASPNSLRIEEFEALQTAATHGHPPQPSSRPGGPPQFEILRQNVREITRPNGRKIRVTPINRLRVVMVQTGYRRIPSGDVNQSKVVDCIYDDGERSWYPGVELFGEGIFLDFAPTDPWHRNMKMAGSAHVEWLKAWSNWENYLGTSLQDTRDQLHPAFVWWHTLSHRLINALSVDSGYSSAAVRERVFVKIDTDTGEASGGVLLYTSQPGGDGTLGGMIALVPHFERVINSALRDVDACSNDPLCGEEKFGEGKYNGAACYACSLISETSCEYRNMRLDRSLLIDNLP